MYKIKSIGTVCIENSYTVIEVDQIYRKAIKFLDKFSHIHVFYLIKSEVGYCIKKDIISIKELNQKKGYIKASMLKNLYRSAELIDIKPYFPSEDTVQSIVTSQKKSNESIWVEKVDAIEKNKNEFSVNAIGNIRNVNGKIYIQLMNMVEVTSEYLIIFWWFDKFDLDQYRRATECNPPYENAPKTGIFATRSPVRPNPIAMTVVHVLRVDYEKKRIYLNNIESFDQTPCIGICEYSSKEDCVRECKVPLWLQHWPKSIDETIAEQINTNIEVKDSFLTELITSKGDEEEREKEIFSNSDENHIINNELDSHVKQMMNRPMEIMIRGARENNLKGLNISIPYGKLTAVVGVSGSGKSSLVNQTIYAECRRRMEYLSHSTNMFPKPLFDEMTGCIPSVVIKQDVIRGNVFSTVGTYTDAYDYLRNIFANVAVRHCQICRNEIIPLTKETICKVLKKQQGVSVFSLTGKKMKNQFLEKNVEEALKDGDGAFYAQIINQKKILFQTKQKCYHCDRIIFDMTPATFNYMDSDSRCLVCNGTGKTTVLDRKKLIERPDRSLLDGASSFYGKLRNFQTNPNANWIKGQVFGLADTMNVNLEESWNNLPEEFKKALLFGDEREVTFSYENKKNGRKGEITRKVEGVYNIIERLLEENDTSNALKKYLTKKECYVCHGEKLAMEGRLATLNGKRYPEVANMTFSEIVDFCKELKLKMNLNSYQKITISVNTLLVIAETALRLGVGHLPLSQETGTLSGGEGQRLKLLGAFKNHLSGILYIFDEPSKGLHPKDYHRVIELMKGLIQEGNTIIMVEHNEDMIRVADNVIEIGPGAGVNGGILVGEGTLTAMLSHKETQISKYMKENKTKQVIFNSTKKKQYEFFSIENLVSNNLKNICVNIPLQALTCICGVSGSGKSTLMKNEIYSQAQKNKKFCNVVMVDQTLIGKNSKSIIATYIGFMDFIRSEYANTSEALGNKWDESYFSFNSPNGQCDTCKGDGKIKIKYTEDIAIECPDCHGIRYKKKILNIQYRGKNIGQLLNLSVDQAIEFLSDANMKTQCLMSLQRVGLGYLNLGQGTATLSGGEASRLRLAKELLNKSTRNVLYLLDEPTTGLHFSDVENLLKLIDELIKNGNTVVTIEHNKQFLKQANWKIELGPGAGREGGFIMNQNFSDLT